MAAVVNVNGRIVSDKHAFISVFDHGFLYGEGVYEVLRTYNREPFLLDRHLRRLRCSAEAISLEPPLSDAAFGARIRETIQALPVAADEPTEFYIRVLLTRGVGDFGYDPSICPVPTLLIIVKPLGGPPAWYFERGVKLGQRRGLAGAPGAWRVCRLSSAPAGRNGHADRRACRA